jgi:aldose 1-epimerase
MVLTGEQYEITAGDHRAVMTEVGAQLRHYSIGDRAVTVGFDADALPPKCCGAVLMPWPNRIRGGRYTWAGSERQLDLSDPNLGNASHGLVRWARWTRLAATQSSVTLSCEIVPVPGYPHEVSVQVTYSLDETRGLSVAAEARNHGSAAAPFGAGFHPYLDLGGQDLDHIELRIPAQTVLVSDESKIPVSSAGVLGTPYDLSRWRQLGKLRLDHGYTDLTEQRAQVRVGDRTTEVWWDGEFGYLQVFTVQELTPGRSAIAVEPMTCPANAFNSWVGIIELAAGAKWTASWGIKASG